MALNITLKDTQGIKGKNYKQPVKKSVAVATGNIPARDATQAQRDTIMYGGTVRGSRASMDGKSVYELSNKNAILNDRGVQQIASPTQMGRTATQWRKNPSFVAERPQKGTYTGDGRYKQITSPGKFDIQGQIKAQNQGILNPPTDIKTPETPTSLDEMYKGAIGVRKPTKADDIRAELEAKKLEQEQKLQAEKDNLSIIEQTEYLKKTKEQEDYLKQQRALQEEQDRISEEQIKVNEERQLKDASDSISRLRQNLGFLGGSNSVSQQALDSAGRQLSNMTTFYADLKYLNELGGRARSNQYESMKNNFNRDMKLLQDDLDTKVDKVIQSAFNGVTAADISGQMDTVEEVNQMRMRILDSIDQDVASVTRGEIQKRQMLLEQYTQLLEDEKERITLSNTVNTELSGVKGYYVDGNGEAFLDANGKPIPVPPEPPMEPFYDGNTGNLVSFEWDENGKPRPVVTKVLDVPKEVGGNWQYNDKTGEYFRTNAQGQIETSNSRPQGAGDTTITPTDFINRREGFREQAYWDVNGWAVGYGQHAINGVPVKEGDTIDRATADADLANRMANAKYTSLINVELSDYQKAALYSLEHNVGSGVWNFPNGKAIIDAINNGDLQKASNILATSGIGTTNAATGEVMEGLVNRRREEAELLMIPKDFDLWGSEPQQVTIDEIISYNDDVSRRQMLPEDVRRIGEAKQQVMNDPNSDINDILQWSAGGKAIGETASKTLIKFDQALQQLGMVQDQIKDMDTGPIIGRLRSINPWDTDAQVLKAQIQGLVPQIARGVYGEVGVLTDNDVRLYAQTLPNIKGTENVNKGVLALTLDILAGGYKKQLVSLAGQGYDVSGMEGVYDNIKGQADYIRSELGITGGQGGGVDDVQLTKQELDWLNQREANK